MTGPLTGVKVLEIAGVGPGPHAAMLLADLGADVLRIDRPGPVWGPDEDQWDILARGRPSAVLDLKHVDAVATVLRLLDTAGVLVEGMRPGVMERLGLGPEVCLDRNPRLVYARMTGWGQDGPWSRLAGHDINYIATSGALYGLGQDPAQPHFPSNLLGDFGGGSTYLVIGILAALLDAHGNGHGQVVDAAIVDGVSHLNALYAGFLATGAVSAETRAGSTLDGGAPFYGVYETGDGRHMAVGSLEPQFYGLLLEGLELTESPDRDDPEQLPALRETLRRRFLEMTQAEWCAVFEDTDACVTPVLTVTEASRHPALAERGTLVEVDGRLQPAPAPRFSRSSPTLGRGPSRPGADTRAALTRWGIADVDDLIASGVARQT